VETTIGSRLREGRLRLAAAGLVGAAVVPADFVLVCDGDVSYSGLRAVLPFGVLAIYAILARGDAASVGLALRPIQGFRYWIKATLVIGIAVGAVIACATLPLVLLGRDVPFLALPPRTAGSYFVRMCIVAPTVEEATYRLAFCTAAVAVIGPRWTIALSGLAFALLHVLYGNPGPDNVVAGFFLAWAYLKSGSILVPVVLHSLGNLCVLAAWVVHWYWMHGGFWM
jgi:membrane protease YdiL (CAAX protease family)